MAGILTAASWAPLEQATVDEIVNQTKLSAEQIEAFYHDQFVDDQIQDFLAVFRERRIAGTIVDIGGGCGFFAKQLAQSTGAKTRVIDMDPRSIEECERIGVDGLIGDALSPTPCGDESVATFNLILHHLVGSSEKKTRDLQLKALESWKERADFLFVNEYIYQSFAGNLSGRLIYEITSSRFLSAIGRFVSKIIPSLKANTFGVGVRFRSHDEWRQLFSEAGYRVIDSRIGKPEYISPPLRGLMIKTIRRDSFLLAAS